jgi:hypothetical protein
MELARLWLDAAGPQAVIEALAPALPGLVVDEATAEARVGFDAHSGGVRNHDVLAYGHVAAGTTPPSVRCVTSCSRLLPARWPQPETTPSRPPSWRTMSARHGAELAVKHSVPCWIAVVETPALISSA